MLNKRILVSARDAGAAHSLVPVLMMLQHKPDFDLQLVATGPALQIFASAGLTAQNFSHRAAASSTGENASHLIKAASDLIARYKPNLILTGLSGSDAGIDEALHVAAGEKIPTVALQDFWGDVNPVFPQKPDVYLVADRFAADITRQRVPGVDTFVIGYPKYSDFQDINVDKLRVKNRELLSVSNSQGLAVFFSQPLWDLAGYRAAFRQLVQCLATTQPNAVFAFRTHPRDTLASIELANKTIKEFGLQCADDQGISSLEILAACDVSFSAFSLTGLDHLFLQRCASIPIGVPLYLLYDQEVLQTFRSYCALDYMPLSEAGLVETIYDADHLPQKILDAQDPAFREQSWKTCKAHLTCSQQAISDILHALETIMARTCV